jgi:small-conductance mechanosensitive channel
LLDHEEDSTSVSIEKNNMAEIIDDPKPFVLQTALNDFNVAYQLNAYTKNPSKMVVTYSELHQNLQDFLNEKRH